MSVCLSLVSGPFNNQSYCYVLPNLIRVVDVHALLALKVRTLHWRVKYSSLSAEQECVKYKELNKVDRSESSRLPSGTAPACDKKLKPGWYRFQKPAGNLMASKCLPSARCGTVVTGWLSSPHPKMTDGIVNGKVCYSWKSDCCKWDQDIKLRNCGRFYVYKLAGTQACPMGFCGSAASGKFYD